MQYTATYQTDKVSAGTRRLFNRGRNGKFNCHRNEVTNR
jgi:hypothetical protein